MKSLVIITLSVLSQAALALNSNSTWAEILASKNVSVQMPQIAFKAGVVGTTLVSIDGVCVAADGFYTKSAQDVFAPGFDGNLEVVGKAILKTGLTKIAYYPVNEGTGVEVVEAIPTSYKVAVASLGNGEAEGSVLFNKVYTIASCQ